MRGQESFPTLPPLGFHVHSVGTGEKMHGGGGITGPAHLRFVKVHHHNF